MNVMLSIYNKSAVLMLLLLFGISCNNVITDTNIYGQWKGSYNGHEVSFIFRSDNTCALSFLNEHTKKHETISGNYELNILKRPIPLSIHNIAQLNYPLHSIIEFIRDDSIRIAKFSPKLKLRPISFGTGNELHFKRILKEGIKNATIIR